MPQTMSAEPALDTALMKGGMAPYSDEGAPDSPVSVGIESEEETAAFTFDG